MKIKKIFLILIMICSIDIGLLASSNTSNNGENAGEGVLASGALLYGGYKLLGSKKTVDSKLKTVDPKLKTVDPKLKTVDPKLKTVDPKLKTVDSRSSGASRSPIKPRTDFQEITEKGTFKPIEKVASEEKVLKFEEQHLLEKINGGDVFENFKNVYSTDEKVDSNVDENVDSNVAKKQIKAGVEKATEQLPIENKPKEVENLIEKTTEGGIMNSAESIKQDLKPFNPEGGMFVDLNSNMPLSVPIERPVMDLTKDPELLALKKINPEPVDDEKGLFKRVVDTGKKLIKEAFPDRAATSSGSEAGRLKDINSSNDSANYETLDI